MLRKLICLFFIWGVSVFSYIPFNPILKENGDPYIRDLSPYVYQGESQYVIGWLEMPHGDVEKAVGKIGTGQIYFDRILAACVPQVSNPAGDNKPYVDPWSLMYVKPIIKSGKTTFEKITGAERVWQSDWKDWCANVKKQFTSKPAYRGHIDDAYWFDHVLPQAKQASTSIPVRKNPQKKVALFDQFSQYYVPHMINFATSAVQEEFLRPWIFYDVMGITESYFQEILKQCGETKNPKVRREKLFPTLFANATKDDLHFFKGRVSIAETGRFSSWKIADLRSYFDQYIKGKYNINSVAPLRIIDGFGVRKGEERTLQTIKDAGIVQNMSVEVGVPETADQRAVRVTDIQHLQEVVDNQDAIFMVASNFNALEGGRGRFHNHLNNMQFKAVQGENAALTAMGAAIQRKYLYHTQYTQQGIEAGGIDLLAHLNKVKSDVQGTVKSIQAPLNDQDVEQIAVGVHEHVIPTSGFYYPYSRKGTPGFISIPPNDPRVQFLEEMGFLDKGRDPFYLYNSITPIQLLHQQHVHQIFAAALNLGKGQHEKRYLNTRAEDEEAARVILQAAYEGAILQAARYAYQSGKIQRGESQKVYLTLIGTGAFGNKLEWIANVIRNNQYIADAIKNANLEVYLVIYAGAAPDSASQQYDIIRQAVSDFNARLQKQTEITKGNKQSPERVLRELCISLSALYEAVA